MEIKAANEPSSSAPMEQSGIAIRCSALLAIPSSDSLALRVHIFTPAVESFGRSLVSMRGSMSGSCSPACEANVSSQPDGTVARL